MFSPLKNSTYLRLYGAQVIALLGTGLTTVALALLAYDLAGGEAGKGKAQKRSQRSDRARMCALARQMSGVNAW